MIGRGFNDGAVVVLGANGFPGRYVCRHFARLGREVVAVGRRRDGWCGDGIWLPWDGVTIGPWALALEGAAAVINLAGCRPGGRPTAAHRQAIIDSRVLPTRLLGEALAGCREAPRVWLNASSALIYRDASDHPVDEWRGEPGGGVAVEVVRAGEDALFGCRVPGRVRKVALRTGLVLASERATAFDRLQALARLGFGGAMAGGHQRVCWLHLADFLTALEWLIERLDLDGPVNLCAPEAPDNRAFMHAVRAAAGIPLGLPIPRRLLKIASCRFEPQLESLLVSRWVAPARLLAAGFSFAFPAVGPALADLAARPGIDRFFAAADQPSAARPTPTAPDPFAAPAGKSPRRASIPL
jgi:hypothetical protein